MNEPSRIEEVQAIAEQTCRIFHSMLHFLTC